MRKIAYVVAGFIGLVVLLIIGAYALGRNTTSTAPELAVGPSPTDVTLAAAAAVNGQVLTTSGLATMPYGAADLSSTTRRAEAAPPPWEMFEAACATDNPYLVTTCFARAGETGEPALVAFHDTTDNSDHIPLATAGQVGATYGLAYSREPALYAAAFLKRGVPFGPAGPGAIYRFQARWL